eukprot:1146939-Pelagomonas_calceolata.AAC.8
MKHSNYAQPGRHCTALPGPPCRPKPAHCRRAHCCPHATCGGAPDDNGKGKAECDAFACLMSLHI